MDALDFEKEFSEWVLIRDYAAVAPLSTSPINPSPIALSCSSRPLAPAKDASSYSNVNGDIIFSLPEHIILSVLNYSSTNPYALYRTVSLVCRQFTALAKKLPLQLVIHSPTTQRLPDCKIVSLTITTPVSSEVIKLIGTRYASSLRVLKLSHLNTTRETTLNEDSFLPLRKLTKLRQLALAWKSGPTMVPKAFAFISSLSNLRKLSLEIYEKDGIESLRIASGVYTPLLSYMIPPQDDHEHTVNCLRCPYAAITPLARSAASNLMNSASPRLSPGASLHSSSTSSPGHTASGSSGVVLHHPQASSSYIASPTQSPLISPTSSPTSFSSAATSPTMPTHTSQFTESKQMSDLPMRATSAGIPHSPIDPTTKRTKMIQSSPAHHVKPVQTISTAGINNPSVSFLKIVTDLTLLEELKLSNWRDFGPLFLLASLTKVTTLTIKGRPNDLMTDGASVADASRHFLFLATLQVLRSLTLAWIPPCLPQLVRLSTLDLSQAPNLDNTCVAEFSKGLVNLTSLSLDGQASGGLLSDVGVRCLSNLHHLTYLDVSNHHQITEESFSRAPWPLVDLRVNHTSITSLVTLSRFSNTLVHLHADRCELLSVENVALNLRLLPRLVTFRFINGELSTIGGINEKLLAGYLDCPNVVCLCDRVICSPRVISILPGLSKLQFLELCLDTPFSKQNDLFEPLAYITSLQSIVLTGISLNASLIQYLVRLPSLASLTASKVDESMSPKAILKLSSLHYLSICLSSSSVADRWTKYVVRLPDLIYYSDGMQHPGDLPWATSRRLYLEWHPRAFKTSRSNNCTIS